MFVINRSDLGDYSDLFSSLANIGGAIGITAIQSDLAKSLARREANAAIARDQIEMQRQVALVQAEADALATQMEKQSAGEALVAQALAQATATKTGAYAGFLKTTGPWLALGVVLAGGLIVVLRKVR